MDSFVFKHGDTVFTAQPEINRYAVELGNGERFEMIKKPSVLLGTGEKLEFPAPSYSRKVDSGTSYTVKTVYENMYGLGITAVCHAGVDITTGDIVFSINVLGDVQGQISKVMYPAPFVFGAAPGEGYTVLSRMQGTIIPAGEPIIVETGLIFQRDAYMPIFAQIRRGSGYTAIYDTPYDAMYEPEGDTVAPVWISSLGRMSYTRKIRYVFREKCDHNVAAKCYRKYLEERGMIVTLKEKEIRNPKVSAMPGLPVIHAGIAFHTSPDSDFYDSEHPENNDSFISFAERAGQLRRLRSLGLEHAYTHFDGWGKHGYDNLHPSPFPPNEDAGGAEGMKYLSDTCREIGYIFGIHDQYRDYYYDNPDFSFDEALTFSDGSHPYHSVWLGGKHTFLCSELAQDYVRRNYNKFRQLGINIDASYLDVFSVVELDECFAPDHMCTRKICAENRRRCLDMLTSRGIIPSSEEAIDCIIPSMVLCHHAPFFTKILGDENSDPVGIPIPLFELVYHDCLIVPWIGLPGKRGGWGIPKNDSAYVYAILYGCPVYCPIDADENDIADVKYACDNAKRLAHAELVRHEFIDGNIRSQRTYFSDGTVIEADLDSGEFKIK